MTSKNTTLMGAVAVAALLLAPVANAQLSLSLNDGTGGSVLLTDADGDGQINFGGAVGSWMANISSAFGAPLLGDVYTDEFDLLSANVSGSTGTMTVMMTQTDLTRTDAPWLTSVGGTTNGSVSFKSYVDASNGAFALTNLVTSDMFSTSSYSSIDSGGASSLGLSGPYSWTIVAEVTHGQKKNISSFDYNVKIPEPTSLALMGIGLLGAGFAARRKNKANAATA